MIIIILAVIIVFGIYNFAWLEWKNIKYQSYTKGLEEFIENKSYVYTADDNYLYNVKLPDYLTYTGNLCVSVPKGEYALIIWPKVISGYDYGVQLQIDKQTYSIMLNEDLSAEDSQYDEMVDKYSDIITELHEKAKSMWNIE